MEADAAVDAEIASLTETFDGFMDDRNWPFALATAKHARELAPWLPHTELMVWKANFAARDEAGRRTAEAPAECVLTPVAFQASAAPASRIPAGTYTRTLNDQRVTVTFTPTGAATGTVSGSCTVPNGGCDLTFAGDCTATADGLIYGVVCDAKTCDADDADPSAKLSVEAFCQALDRPAVQPAVPPDRGRLHADEREVRRRRDRRDPRPRRAGVPAADDVQRGLRRGVRRTTRVS